MVMTRNQKGFSPIFIILILLLLALLGFAGWRIWESRDDKGGKIPSSSDSAPASADPEEPAAPALNYVKPPSEVYRVALPDTWVKATCPDTPDLLFLAPTTDKLGKCNSEFGGTVTISKASGDVSHPAAYYSGDSHLSGVSYATTTIDSINGYKVSYTVSTEYEIGTPAVGTQQTQWVLFDGTNSFIMVYTRLPGDPDLAAAAQTLAETFDKL
ncbi:MAG TPA: hypothetical protein VK694_05810 [Verrucomicrobiae bacterium]|nr:hypothetical protein [Verrucomicrobiae bacterium]